MTATMRPPSEKFIIFSLVVMFLLILLEAISSGAGITVTTCTLEAEDGVKNNRGEVAYYNCGTTAAFMVVTDSPGELHLRQLKGQTVDVVLSPIPGQRLFPF